VNRRIPADPIPVIDLFAGPGGLGEGFSSLGTPTSPVFRIRVSAEADRAAHSTLKLRAYYRSLLRSGNKKLIQLYYDYCHQDRAYPYDDISIEQQKEAANEALCLKLGEPDSDRKLYSILDDLDLPNRPWVLIGGPPCQAYSIVGRSRNRGKDDYVPEKDHRHYLYREYLKIIQRYRPTVFVMENVKGLLSSKIGEQKIFHQMLIDLADPDQALGKSGQQATSRHYRIHSLSSNVIFDGKEKPEDMDVGAFVVRAEQYGVPQARHRVILLGVSSDLRIPSPLKKSRPVSTQAAIKRLPKLRSSISRAEDSEMIWAREVRAHARDLAHVAREAGNRQLANLLHRISSKKLPGGTKPGRTQKRNDKERRALGAELVRHFRDDRLRAWLNHESRSHMSSDLRRYLFAAAFAALSDSGASPKGFRDFNLPGLAPKHKNWKSGVFADRFRVQVWKRPSTTITSHIAKDGHYYIHPDPTQCRSLTVREAARLQTFPDNYLFCGNRTEQYVQVGNAVPPLLARKLALVVRGIMRSKK
jgi:DNA (cytosine-5)-methyltransferase 1